MASRSPKDKIILKLGARLTGVQPDDEIGKLRKENAYLKKSLDDLSRQGGESSDSENNKLLLERILKLETIREKNSQQILSRDQEIATLMEQLCLDRDEIVGSLQEQLNQKIEELEMREKMFQSLKQETDDVKNKLVAVSVKCQELENCVENSQNCPSDGQAAVSEAVVIQEHLRDALEKNQQWLAYDQQREAYVKALLARAQQLERQLSQAHEALRRQHKEADSEERRSLEVQEQYEHLLRSVRGEVEAERERVAQAQRELTQLQWQHEEAQREVGEARQELLAERLHGRKGAKEERRRSSDWAVRKQAELENVQGKLEEERLRATELLQQVHLLQKSLLNQQEELEKISVLEQQIQLSAKEIENERRDNQHLQSQLHKVLRELRKAKGHIARLESQVESSSRQERASRDSLHGLPSASNAPDLLDESFLECPNCSTRYPTRCHRELLLHVEQCFG